MKQLPIIMTAESVLAILDDRKTQTRRVVTRMNTNVDGHGRVSKEFWESFDFDKAIVDTGPSPAGNPGPYLKVPHSDGTTHRLYPDTQAGDLKWVKETFFHDGTNEPGALHFRANATKVDENWFKEEGWKWKSPLFMPKKFARLWLEVKDVRAERVQDITDEDCRAEGIGGLGGMVGANTAMLVTGTSSLEEAELYTLATNFIELWDSINAKRGYPWKNNDWVWAYEFERTERPTI